MNTSPQQIYRSRLAAGTLQPDAAHAALVEQLDTLYQQLLSPSSPRRRGSSTLQRWIPAFAGMTKKKIAHNLYLWGEVGRGKSMLMDLLVESLPEGFPVRRIHYHAFMAEIHHRLHARREWGKGSADALQPVAEEFATDLRLLCLDEFQVTDIADAMILSRLFTLLLDAGVCIVTTSNRIPDDLYKNGLQREYFLQFIELVKARFKVLELTSPHDYRMQKLQGHAAYFTPADNTTEMQELFNSLRTLPPAPCALIVNDRQLALPVTASGMAWCSFDELCRQPLGAEDYAEIAANFHTLFLHSIPQLTREDRNEAKRFITLIDTLYEYKTRLFCAAAIPPEYLYPSGEGHFEFARTVSRLKEMGSAEWLGVTSPDYRHDTV